MSALRSTLCRVWIKPALACTLAVCLSAPAAAYYGGTFSWSDPAGGYAEWSRARLYQDTVDYNRKLAQRRSSSSGNKSSSNAAAGGAGKQAQAAASEPKARNPKAYEFKPSKQVSAQVMDDFLDALLKHGKANGMDAKGQKQIRDMRGWDVINVMRERIRKQGQNPDSLASAMGLWLLVNYGTIHKAEGGDVPMTNLIGQLEASMSNDAATLAMSDREKQRAAETMLWMTFVQILANAELGDDPAQRQQAAKLARESLKAQGIDPDKMHITKKGLEIKP